jgi:hypothetical protein
MDLTTTAPRSPKEKLHGLVSLERAIDKAKAYNEGKLGEYHYDCPHDKPLFAFLGTDAQTFAEQVALLQRDDAISRWIEREFLAKKTPAEIEAFNAERMHWHPDPGTPSEQFFLAERRRLGRDDITTWFDLLDVDEGRPVPQPTAV